MRPERELDLREEDETLVPRSRRHAGERREAAGDRRAERRVRGGLPRGSSGGRGGGGHYAGESAIRQPTTGHRPRRDGPAISPDRLGETAGRREGLPQTRGVPQVATTEAPESRRGRDQRASGPRRDVHAAEDEGAQLRRRFAHGSGAGGLQRSPVGIA